MNLLPQVFETFPTRTTKVPLPNQVNHPDIKFHKQKYNIKPYAISLGMPVYQTPYCADPCNHLNILAAYMKRISPRLPHISLLKIHRLKIFVKKFLLEHFKPIEKVIDFQTHLKNWLEQNNTYSVKKKKRMFRIAIRITSNFTHTCRLTGKHYLLKSFIKREFYADRKVPRLINSRSDEFKIAVASYIHAIEDKVYQLKYFVKHADVTTLPKRLITLRKYKYILETDYSSFEGSFSPLYTDVVECELWRYMLQLNPLVLRTILNTYVEEQPRHNQYTPRKQILNNESYTCKVIGSRMSGEMWTSLANGFSNLMNMLFIAEQHNLETDGFVEGDDGLFGFQDDAIAPIDFSELGFTIKMKYGRDLSHTSFCGNIFSPETMHVLIDPEQIIRLNWISDPTYFKAHRRILNNLLKSKALSAYAIGRYTPILGKLCFKIIQLLKTSNKLVFEHQDIWWNMQLQKQIDKMTISYCEPDIIDRLLYQQVFHVPIVLQEQMENIIDQATTLSELDLPFPFLPRSGTLLQIY
jgi:hypothetical protein